MKIHIVAISFLFFIGCAGSNSLVKFVKEGGLETKGLINLALASNGARVIVSEDNPDHPASSLIDGITSSESWGQGEGWEVRYEGFLARGEYIGYGVEDPMVVMERLRNRSRDDDDDQIYSFDPGDPTWRGLRIQTRWGEINTAMGWVIIEFPQEKTVNRAVIYTVDSEKYPADKFGVSDLSLQYWSKSANSWAMVERLGKGKGQAGNEIQDNKSGIITLRFQPVQTSRMRLIIRWTNDSKSMRRGYLQYATGTIRLAEIEIYGYEKEEIAEEQAPSSAGIINANKIAEVEIVIDNYADAYNRKDISMLMSSISPDYSKDGETYSDLKKKMEALFAKYGTVKIELRNVKIKLTESGAEATSTYTAQYRSSVDGSPDVTTSGTLSFNLSNSTGYWKVTRIDSQ